MFKNIDLFTQRYIQIILVIMLVQAAYQYLHIPHNTWLITGICSIYAGFNPGAVLKRSSQRLAGTFVGIALVSIIWHLVHWDFRLLIILTTLMVTSMVFLSLLPYNLSVILNTAFSDISTEWSNSDTFNLQYYIWDRSVCTLIVTSICVSIEYFWFRKRNLSYLNFKHLQKVILKNLYQFFALAQAKHTRVKIFRISNTLLQNIAKLRGLAADAKYEGYTHNLDQAVDKVLLEIKGVHSDIINLSYLRDEPGTEHLVAALTTQISQQLTKFSIQLGISIHDE